MINLCKFQARRSDRKSMDNHPTWSPKGSHKPSKTAEKSMQQNGKKEEEALPRKPGGPCECQRHTNQQDKILTIQKEEKEDSLWGNPNTPWAPLGPERIYWAQWSLGIRGEMAPGVPVSTSSFPGFLVFGVHPLIDFDFRDRGSLLG